MDRGRRNYRQYCGLAAALEVVGGRWTLLIVRELLLGPKRYGELLVALPGIGTNLLAERLKSLVERGVLRRVKSASAREQGYELTELGEQLRAPVLELARLGLAFVGPPSDDQVVRPQWAFLAVQALMEPERAGQIDEAYEFHVDDAVFHIRVDGGVPRGIQGPFDGTPAVSVTTDSATFVEIGAKRLSPFEAVASGRLKLSGSPDAIMRFSILLGLAPDPAVAPVAAVPVSASS